MLKRIISFILALAFIGGIAFAVIAYGRGYRFNAKQKILTSTGILSVSSYPEKASVFIDGKLTSASNASISLSPNWYNVRLTKEGYQSWEKRVRVQGEVVTQLDALLIPNNPSLRALTVNGVLNPALSPTGDKVAYIVSNKEATTPATLAKRGVFILELRSGPLGGKIEPKQIFQSLQEYDYASSKLLWSPDEKKIILRMATSAFQLSLDPDNLPPTQVLSVLGQVLKDWEEEKAIQHELFLTSLHPKAAQFLKEKTSLAKISPDETKILYMATSSATIDGIIIPPLIGSNPTTEVRSVKPNKFYVYDKKEDKNFFITEGAIVKPETLTWYTDSKHIVMIEKDTIYIIDYDGTNKRPVYSGPFKDDLVFPWASGGRLVILTNLNKPQMLPNFYEIDLR